MPESHLPLMRDVLLKESSAIADLAAHLGAPFDLAVSVILGLRGRLAVTGMGKSGHIARKIAATMASTGTPAYFIHPAEASHGDLGMMDGGDGVLALSNSGETAELSDILIYASSRGMPVIGMTGNPGSFLARHSDVLLLMPDAPEGGPLGYAPTTSTTLMLAAGDAVAMALLAARGFTKDGFHTFHPGGKLGARLMTVGEVMHRGGDIPLVGTGARMVDVICEMNDKGFGCTGVVDGGRLVGIITDGDLRRHMGADLLLQTAAEVMSPNPRTVAAEELASTALGMMQSCVITSLFITDGDGVPAGLLHIHDCLRLGLG